MFGNERLQQQLGTEASSHEVRPLLAAPSSSRSVRRRGTRWPDRLTSCGFLVETRESAGDTEVWDVEVTTNRPDAMNHRGLAREAAVATGSALRPLAIELDEGDEPAAELGSVTILEPELCSRYVARVVRGVKIAGSPRLAQTPARDVRRSARERGGGRHQLPAARARAADARFRSPPARRPVDRGPPGDRRVKS